MVSPETMGTGGHAASGAPSRRGLRRLVESLAVFAIVMAGMLRSIHDLAIVWDEGMTFDRQELIRQGWDRLQAGDGTFPRIVDATWRFSREEPDGHGPFYALLSLAGERVSHRFLDPPASYRFGGAVLFALMAATVYGTLRRRWSMAPAATATFLLASLPRVVPEVSTAIVDGPLFCLAMLAWCAFVAGMERPSWRSTIPFGLILGCAMSTKLTGWFLPLPYVLWAVFRWDWRAVGRLLLAGIVALLVVLALNVGWWSDPVGGVYRYFESNLTRAETRPIPILFLGTRYEFSLPWYNTLVWAAVAVPVGTLVLGVVGVAVAIARCRADAFGLLLLLNGLLLMVVRALPPSPGHDGTRQIIISFGFLAILAGYGLEALRSFLANRIGFPRGAVVAGLIGAAAIVESVASVVRYHPLELSYYSPFVGGLPGATRLGFEPTYFWDSLTPEVLDWINANTTERETVLFRNYTPSFHYLRKFERLRADLFLPGRSARPPKWFVLQNRPGLFTDVDTRIVKEASPAYERSLFGVWLIRIYPGEDWIRFRAELNRQSAEETP